MNMRTLLLIDSISTCKYPVEVLQYLDKMCRESVTALSIEIRRLKKILTLSHTDGSRSQQRRLARKKKDIHHYNQLQRIVRYAEDYTEDEVSRFAKFGRYGVKALAVETDRDQTQIQQMDEFLQALPELYKFTFSPVHSRPRVCSPGIRTMTINVGHELTRQAMWWLTLRAAIRSGISVEWLYEQICDSVELQYPHASTFGDTSGRAGYVLNAHLKNDCSVDITLALYNADALNSDVRIRRLMDGTTKIRLLVRDFYETEERLDDRQLVKIALTTEPVDENTVTNIEINSTPIYMKGE